MKYNDKEYLRNNNELKKILMTSALNFAKMSKCAAKQVCCILYKEGNIISIGINGTISGTVNCNELFKKENGIWYEKNNDNWIVCENQEKHHEFSLLNEVHAEVNALSKTTKSPKGAAAIITHSPCNDCIKNLLAFGIDEIYYYNEYDNFNNMKKFLINKGVYLEKIDI